MPSMPAGRENDPHFHIGNDIIFTKDRFSVRLGKKLTKIEFENLEANR